MSLIVMKFGGTSIANVDRIKAVAQRIKEEAEHGHQLVVVVSAMAGVTNQLVGWAHQSSENGLLATEYDVVVSSGEQVTAGLMALALNELGLPARSYLGWQVGFETTGEHKQAQIRHFRDDLLKSSLSKGEIAVVAGFQGVTEHQRLATLGRGGSDYTATTLAAALKADRCDIYTDVDGIYTADPHVITDAKHIEKISYEDVLAFSRNGAKVVQPQAIQQGQQKGLSLRVLSSFNHHPGTEVSDTHSASDHFIGVASRRDLSYFKVKSEGTDILARLSDHAIERDTGWDVVDSAVIPSQDYHTARDVLRDTLTVSSQVAKVALVGHMKDKAPSVLEEVVTGLEGKDIPVIDHQVTDSAVRLIVERSDMEAVVKYLHTHYILNRKSVKDVA